MFSDKLESGEHNSVAEELLLGISELELKCAAVAAAVSEGYFSLNKALAVYKVSELEYLGYHFTQKGRFLKGINKERQIAEAINTIIYVFSAVSNELDAAGKRTLNKLQLISEETIK